MNTKEIEQIRKIQDRMDDERVLSRWDEPLPHRLADRNINITPISSAQYFLENPK